MTRFFSETQQAQPLPEARISWIYLAEILFFVGVVIVLVRWIRNTLLDLGSSSKPSTPREQAVMSSIDNEAAKHLIARGLISTEALAMMSDRERMMLLAATARQIGAPPPTSPDTPVPVSPRVAPIALHCPLCGTLVTPGPQPIPFVVKCDGCDKRIHVRGDGPERLSIVLSAREDEKTGRRDSSA